MKRNEKKIAEFDEIIFENRNRNYGAFDLRKRYSSTTSFSIIGGVFVFTVLTISLSLAGGETKAVDNEPVITVIRYDPVTPDQLTTPAAKPPAEPARQVLNLKPVVSDDTTDMPAYIPTAEETAESAGNGLPEADTTEVIYAEPTAGPANEPRVFVEEMPEFPGGTTALLKYVGSNINYPSEASDNNIEGKVIVGFVVNGNGSVNRVKILRSVNPALDSEAVRVVRTLPRFKPGKQNGVAVPVLFSLPVSFKIAHN